MIVKDDLVEKYRKRLEQEFSNQSKKSIAFSSNYLDFKKELLPAHLSAYENLCNISESIIKISPDKKSSSEIQEQIDMCHLSISPTGVFSFAVLSFILVFVSLSLVGFAVFRSVFFVFYSMLVAAVVLAALLKLPEFFGNNWRLRASNQMVQTIFYVATYMRHTSNLELAIMFASDHLVPPLSLLLRLPFLPCQFP